ncbi:FadR/GntR family transcriptional regulator [Brachybacterium fresconis]|uniref:DNA-binding FadR family transcriptional regulator n=1 Tax=Brachybacterium fresconis TaxID=173363 RepID=A0ABS4YNF1_9MICO|nr:FCD domain-containing protein [Brachybacterium fresconis]MBP2410249.1 DNA-binding FadR family transcriptional regulator [Brachybacterium fresconis]
MTHVTPRFETLQAELLELIQTLGLKSHDALPSEGELAERLGVSRATLREATRALQSQGVLDAQQGRGLFLRSFSVEPVISRLPYQLIESGADLDELLVARAALERGLIREVAERIGEQRLARLDEIVQEMHELEAKGLAFPAQDREFHRCLYVDLHNRVIDGTLEAFWQLMDKMRDRLPPLRYDDLADRHAAIVAALRDPQRHDPVVALDDHFIDIQQRSDALAHRDSVVPEEN